MKPDESTLSTMRSIVEKHGEIRAVYLFGSRATGAARPDSDYDLAVVPDPGTATPALKLDLLAELADAGIDNADLAFLDLNRPVLAHEAVRLNRLLFRRPDFESAAFFSRVMRLYFDVQPLLSVQRRALQERLLHGAA